jgi:hypothetical protein
MHHYQRERASITGLGLWSGKCIVTELLVGVVTARLVLPLFVFNVGKVYPHGHPLRSILG